MIVLLAACGGGNGGGSPQPPPDSPSPPAGDDPGTDDPGPDDPEPDDPDPDNPGPDDPEPDNQPLSAITDTDAAPNSIEELAPAGTAVGITAHATDEDEADAVSYQLTADSSGGLFSIDPVTGVVSLAATGLDYEAASSHTITIVANSSDGTSSTANFTIAVVDNRAPVLSVAFPPDGALFDGDAITVRGTFADANDIAISNGTDVIDAQLDAATGTWTARVPIVNTAGTSEVTLAISASGDNAELVTATRTLRTGTLIGDMGLLVIDEARSQLIVADNRNERLIRIDTRNWSQSVLSGSGVGEGANLVSIAGMVLDPLRERVLVTDSSLDAVVAVDINNGNRQVISGAGVGAGPQLQSPAGLTLRGDDILLVDALLNAVVEVDTSDGGSRTILSGPGIGSGVGFGRPTAIVLANPADPTRAHVISPLGDRLFDVDLNTGDRIAYENPSTTGANRFGDVAQVALVDGNILVVDFGGISVSRVNPLDGTRSTFSSAFDGNGPDFQALAGIAFGTGNNGDPRLIATDAGVDKVFALVGGGARQLTPVNAIGAGELIREGSGQIEFDPVAKRLYYRDLLSAALYSNLGVLSIDAEQGDREWFNAAASFVSVTDLAVDETSGRVFFTDGSSVRELDATTTEFPYRSSSEPGNAVGDGIGLQSAESIFYDAGANESYVADVDSNALIRVDMVTGDRFVVSDEDTNSPFALNDIYSELVVDVARGRAVAIAWDNTLFAADLTTGVRSAFASDAPGWPLDNFFTDIALDRDNGRVVAVLQFAGRIDAIDVASQIRTVVSSAGVGAGPALASPYRLSLDEQNQVAFVVDRVLAAVFAVDLQSGDRVIMSK